jgi:hypothetical protein
MSFTATVENDIVRLPEGIHVPNGSEVRVELVRTTLPVPRRPDWVDRATGGATTGLTTDQILRATRGEE